MCSEILIWSFTHCAYLFCWIDVDVWTEPLSCLQQPSWSRDWWWVAGTGPGHNRSSSFISITFCLSAGCLTNDTAALPTTYNTPRLRGIHRSYFYTHGWALSYIKGPMYSSAIFGGFGPHFWVFQISMKPKPFLVVKVGPPHPTPGPGWEQIFEVQRNYTNHQVVKRWWLCDCFASSDGFNQHSVGLATAGG